MKTENASRYLQFVAEFYAMPNASINMQFRDALHLKKALHGGRIFARLSNPRAKLIKHERDGQHEDGQEA
jgi:hypothetical protein